MAFMGYIKQVQVPGTRRPGSIITVPRRERSRDFVISVTGETLNPTAAASSDEYFWVGGMRGSTQVSKGFAFKLSDRSRVPALDLYPTQGLGWLSMSFLTIGSASYILGILRNASTRAVSLDAWTLPSGIPSTLTGNTALPSNAITPSTGAGDAVCFSRGYIILASGVRGGFSFRVYTPSFSGGNVMLSEVSGSPFSDTFSGFSDTNFDISGIISQDNGFWISIADFSDNRRFSVSSSGSITRNSAREVREPHSDYTCGFSDEEGYFIADTSAREFDFFRTRNAPVITPPVDELRRIKPTLFAYTLADTARHKHYPSSIWRTKPEYKVPRIASTSIARDTSEDFATGLSGASLRIKASAIKGNTLFLGTFLTSDRRASSGVAYNLQTKTRDNTLDFSIPGMRIQGMGYDEKRDLLWLVGLSNTSRSVISVDASQTPPSILQTFDPVPSLNTPAGTDRPTACFVDGDTLYLVNQTTNHAVDAVAKAYTIGGSGSSRTLTYNSSKNMTIPAAMLQTGFINSLAKSRNIFWVCQYATDAANSKAIAFTISSTGSFVRTSALDINDIPLQTFAIAASDNALYTFRQTDSDREAKGYKLQHAGGIDPNQFPVAGVYRAGDEDVRLVAGSGEIRGSAVLPGGETIVLAVRGENRFYAFNIRTGAAERTTLLSGYSVTRPRGLTNIGNVIFVASQTRTIRAYGFASPTTIDRGTGWDDLALASTLGRIPPQGIATDGDTMMWVIARDNTYRIITVNQATTTLTLDSTVRNMPGLTVTPGVNVIGANETGGMVYWKGRIYIANAGFPSKLIAYSIGTGGVLARDATNDIDTGLPIANKPHTICVYGDTLYLTDLTSIGQPDAVADAKNMRVWKYGDHIPRERLYQRDTRVPVITALASNPAEIDEDISSSLALSNIVLSWNSSGTVTNRKVTDLHRHANVPIEANNMARPPRPLATTVYSLEETNTFGTVSASITVPVFKDCVINSFSVRYITNPLSTHGATVYFDINVTGKPRPTVSIDNGVGGANTHLTYNEDTGVLSGRIVHAFAGPRVFTATLTASNIQANGVAGPTVTRQVTVTIP